MQKKYVVHKDNIALLVIKKQSFGLINTTFNQTKTKCFSIMLEKAAQSDVKEF